MLKYACSFSFSRWKRIDSVLYVSVVCMQLCMYHYIIPFLHWWFWITACLWLAFEQGEAKSAELIGQAIANNPAFLALRQIEAAREISHTMAASSNKVFLDSRDLLLGLQQLNVGGKQKKWSDRPVQSHATVDESSLRETLSSI